MDRSAFYRETKVVCNDVRFCGGGLTVGKVYEVASETDLMIGIIDDRGMYSTYCKSRFRKEEDIINLPEWF